MNMKNIKHQFIALVLLTLLVYSRFVNLGWGLPYPMHPDERNMADAVMRTGCDNPAELLRAITVLAPRNLVTYLTVGEFALPNTQIECLNPHFFAYGQLSLFVGGGIAQVIHRLSRIITLIPPNSVINFSESVMGLRIWSALVSCLTALVLLQILRKLNSLFERRLYRYVALLTIIFSPVLIQLAHFGTTEAVLMFWYVVLTYLAICAIQRENLSIRDLVYMGTVCGLAIATKSSSLLFLTIPVMVIFVKSATRYFVDRNTKTELVPNVIDSEDIIVTSTEKTVVSGSWRPYVNLGVWSRFIFISGVGVIFLTIVAGLSSFIFSPHNFISLRELLSSMRYESDVGLGRTIPFYTRQFLLETPLLFQMRHIFPYALGLPVLLWALVGFCMLPFNRSYNMLRFSVLSYAALTMGWYAKWTRFLAPVYPIIVLMAVLGLTYIFQKIVLSIRSRTVSSLIGIALLLSCVVPGVMFLSIYTKRDVRFVASEWVYTHIPSGSYVLSETANVIDIPIPDVRNKGQIPDGFNIQYLSFNSYEVDVDQALQSNLKDAIAQADYIFVPSRRVFYNHTCVDLTGKITPTRHSKEKCAYLARTYPVLKSYYEDLFSGKSGFTQVAVFTSYPRIQLFEETIFESPDEPAEETSTVFDHPVMRIYKKSTQ